MTVHVYRDQWGWAWWCYRCETGINQRSPLTAYAKNEGGARAVADVHRCAGAEGR